MINIMLQDMKDSFNYKQSDVSYGFFAFKFALLIFMICLYIVTGIFISMSGKYAGGIVDCHFYLALGALWLSYNGYSKTHGLKLDRMLLIISAVISFFCAFYSDFLHTQWMFVAYSIIGVMFYLYINEAHNIIRKTYFNTLSVA